MRHLAEATVHAGGRTLFANENATDMYASIDGLANKLDRQVRHHKDRISNHRKTKPEILESGNGVL